MTLCRTALLVVWTVLTLSACGSSPTAPAPSTGSGSGGTTSGSVVETPVYVVLFTHIEDNVPAGDLGSNISRQNYNKMRQGLIDMATLAKRYSVKWVLQPDWTMLVAAQAYETTDVMASTGGKNIYRYLHDTLGVTIDPHSHENDGYNYSDVAALLDQLGVGGTAVMGGHIWDPSLSSFQNWDRFRTLVAGQRYPSFRWKADILMGAGTPNHVNDPIVSGVWRPKDRNNFFTDSTTGNIVSVGQFKGDVAGITELVTLAKAGTIASNCMKTVSIHILPGNLTTTAGLATVESAYVAPVAALGSNIAVTTDFTSLVSTWRAQFGSNGCVYRQ